MHSQSTNFYSSVEEYTNSHGGEHFIRKVLIANNGIGAIKAIRSIRRWSYETFGNERMIQFVAMATPEDFSANAEYIRLADEVIDVPGGSNNNNYANVNLICEIADRLQIDAVMPLWGHASENPNLPTSLEKCHRKVVFIGPSAESMQALGDKIGSTIIAQSSGVPTIAWNGDGLLVDYQKEGIPPELYDQANVCSAEDALACCIRIGFPVMIKASEGGGGKGIRKVLREEDVESLFRQVQGEVPGSPIFIMKLASKCRHLEVQLLADKHGEAIALSGRDCSVQRRHQKIIEEGPPIAAPPHIFKKMERAAVALAKTVGYCNAGTVEYLYVEETQQFAFLELNPRLQVEHPVTETILGLNLPACQLQVAMGIPLHRIPDIRRMYGRHPAGRDTIDFEYADPVPISRHCIAVRVTAENPETGFQPTSGKIEEIHFRSSADVWGYFSIDSSGLVHQFADSQFGHIFARGNDRESARRAMVVALKELEIRGEIRTTIEYIIKLIQSDEYINNQIDTAWLDAHLSTKSASILSQVKALSPQLVATCGAAVLGFRLFQRRGSEFTELLRLGQVPSIDTLALDAELDLIYNGIKFQVRCLQRGSTTLSLLCNGGEQLVNIRVLADGGYLMDVSGRSHIAYTIEEGDGSTRLILDGQTCLFTPEVDPTRLTSSVAGKIAKLLVPDGTHLCKGDAYVEIEVMKMYMSLKSEEAGTVHFQKSEGASLKPGDLIALVTLDRPDFVIMAEEFTGKFGNLAEGHESSSTSVSLLGLGPGQQSKMPPHVALRHAHSILVSVLAGFSVTETEIGVAIEQLRNFALEPLLPLYELEEALSVLRGRLDNAIYSDLCEYGAAYRKAVIEGASPAAFPAGAILSSLHQYLQSLPMDRRSIANQLTSNLWDVVEKYLYQPNVRILMKLLRFTETYLDVELLFDSMSFTDVVNSLRKDHINNIGKVLELCRSHANLHYKNILMLKTMDIMKDTNVPSMSQSVKVPPGVPLRSEISIRTLKRRLGALSKLRQPRYSRVSLAASLMLMEQNSLTYEQRKLRLHDAIIAALSTGEGVGGPERTSHISNFAETSVTLRDLLYESLLQDREYQIATLELYVRKIYEKTHILGNLHSSSYLYVESRKESYQCPWISFTFLNKLTKGRESQYCSMVDLTRRTSSFGSSSRTGLFAVTESMEEMKYLFPMLLETPVVKASGYPSSTDLTLLTTKHRKVHVLHIILMRSPPGDDANSISRQIAAFLQTQVAVLRGSGVSRVSFFVASFTPVTAAATTTTTLTPAATVTPSVRAPFNFAGIFTFRATDNFAEDDLFRNIEAPHAYYLDLARLSNFDIIHGDYQHSTSGNVHIYKAVPKGLPKAPPRYFARLVAFTSDSSPSSAAEVEAIIVETLDSLALIIGQEDIRHHAAHIFLNILAPHTVIDPYFYLSALKKICSKYASKLVRLVVSHIELKLTCRLKPEEEDPSIIRLITSDPTGYVLRIDQYIEEGESASLSQSLLIDEMQSNEVTVFRSTGGGPRGEWDGLPVNTPYAVSQPFDAERAEAQNSSDTLYVYDWPVLFRRAVEMQWEEHFKEKQMLPLRRPSYSQHPSTPSLLKRQPSDQISDMIAGLSGLFDCKELVLHQVESGERLLSPLPPHWSATTALQSRLLPVDRLPGLNDCGVVAFEMTMRTPECSELEGQGGQGRHIVVICNDITKESGSFGTREDAMFFKASQYAREHGFPRLFLTANSGARIGMAQSLKALFKVCWIDASDPPKGFQYIYLTESDYLTLLGKANDNERDMPVVCTRTAVPGGEVRYIITDIIGEEPDLGVENLSGSGHIAGETSRAYDDIFTLTLVVGRTVGIGAYLVRLGQRTIQKTRSSPIILTGFQALNKLMGRDIYSTNDQLGGPTIMFHNGVSHLLADSHLSAVKQALTWLAFIPSRRGAPLPVKDISGIDDVDRDIGFTPEKGVTYDPRLLLCGVPPSDDEDIPLLGFCDKGSFVETLAGWAKTVVVGRGRLGGIPIGVIVTENRMAEATKPADPADVTSQEKMVQQAGGVWFPDSAYKTAQALRDFNREELPCIIFANWRGFSGGQRDMFDEVLKFGSMIVDALVAYKQPLFVYIPPHAELRGGAWVVVDSTINEEVMEFYAAEDARGGVLEAPGAASIKFREKDVVAAAWRLDPTLQNLRQTLSRKGTEAVAGEERQALEREATQRVANLIGVYQQIAVHFADLHDTPGRMVRTGVVRKQVSWAQSRSFFYWRLRRKLGEFEFAKKINPSTSGDSIIRGGESIVSGRKKTSQLLKQLFEESYDDSSSWEDDDETVVNWMESHAEEIDNRMDVLRKEELESKFRHLIGEVSAMFGGKKELRSDQLAETLKSVVRQSPTELRHVLLDAFAKTVNDLQRLDDSNLE